jgi:hypothetical protein
MKIELHRKIRTPLLSQPPTLQQRKHKTYIQPANSTYSRTVSTVANPTVFDNIIVNNTPSINTILNTSIINNPTIPNPSISDVIINTTISTNLDVDNQNLIIIAVPHSDINNTTTTIHTIHER